jgi:hypothetical protein
MILRMPQCYRASPSKSEDFCAGWDLWKGQVDVLEGTRPAFEIGVQNT